MIGDPDHLEAGGAGRSLQGDLVALLLAEQGPAEGRLHAQSPALGVDLVGTDQAIALLLTRFVLLSILFMFVLGSLVVLTRYVSGYDQQRASATNIIFEMLSATRQVFAISLIISASVTIFATIRGSGRPFVPLVLLAAPSAL